MGLMKWKGRNKKGQILPDGEVSKFVGGLSLWRKICWMTSSPPALYFFYFFFKVQMTSRTPVPLLKSGSVHSGSAS